MTAYRALSDREIATLTAQGCSSADWSAVRVADPFDTDRVRRARLTGRVRIGRLGSVVTVDGVARPDGVYDATLHDCSIGDGARVAGISGHLAGYDIGEGACVEGVGIMSARPGSMFGHGVEVPVINEGGGREVTLFGGLSAQFAHLQALHRHRPGFVGGLRAMGANEAARARADRGTVGPGAWITGVGRIENVSIGAAARVEGAASLCNGTVLSAPDAPAVVGAGVCAEDFIIAEGARVTDGAIISKTYVGQGTRMGRQYSAEGSLFFSNCEAFHGEACSIFAGPYTVTHHKSTLLIAGQFSFYNAGSGSNQSNHMYKLGPVHEGKVERGAKTGSFSYMMWPCRVGPFSVVLGKHTRTFDTGGLPFSVLEASPEGRCMLIPGLNLTAVGTVRDGAKWPKRDRRAECHRRDRISFDVFSPFTVGRMLAGWSALQELYESTDRSVDVVTVRGAEIKRVLLRNGVRSYTMATQMYLLDRLVARVERAIVGGTGSVRRCLATPESAVFSERWADVGGQLMPERRLDGLADKVEGGAIADVAALERALDAAHAAYADDEWAWVKWAYRRVFGADLDEVGADHLAGAADNLLGVRAKFLNLVVGDARREFDKQSRTGFGADGGDADADFAAVRGEYETNTFVEQVREEAAALERRVAEFKGILGRFA